jgi:hypothetical protein
MAVANREARMKVGQHRNDVPFIFENKTGRRLASCSSFTVMAVIESRADFAGDGKEVFRVMFDQIR